MLFGKKIVKRCPKGHEMDLEWRRCPRCTGRTSADEGRDIADATMMAGPPAGAADETRIVTPSMAGMSAARAPEPPKPATRLECAAGPCAGQAFPLELGVYHLGKNPQAPAGGRAFAFPSDRFMSKEHAVLTVGTAQVVLSDPGSTNGTFVNGERVTRTILKDGDELRLGESFFTLRLTR